MKQATDLIIDDLPFLDISLVTYNSSKWVSGFFKSLVNQDYPTSKIYVYIQDNHSNDDTVEACRQAAECYGKYFLGFELSEGENLGFGHRDQSQSLEERFPLLPG
ncbi:MAG: glycosyltransferase [Propionivibrio sp.]|nr:glycosyltransferase [Propionivibrio sp.]